MTPMLQGFCIPQNADYRQNEYLTLHELWQQAKTEWELWSSHSGTPTVPAGSKEHAKNLRRGGYPRLFLWASVLKVVYNGFAMGL